MPKQKRRDQQHINQRTPRKKTFNAGGSQGTEAYKPGFPYNLMSNSKVFYIIGAVIMIGGVALTAILASQPAEDRSIPDLPTATATVEGSTTPDPSASATTTGTPSASPTVNRTYSAAEQVVDTAKSYTATLKTDKGDIVLELLDDQAPRTVNTFVFLAQKQYFDGLKFHRVVADFVVQGGDPLGTGSGGPGFQTEEDRNDLKNTRGMVSMAKAGAVTNFGSQFFINLKDNPALDSDTPSSKRFFPWARVTSGMDVVDKIAQGDIIRSVTIEVK